MAATADTGFGLALFLVALPALIPLLPFGSTLVGLMLVLVGIQMAIGMKQPWLPACLRAFVFSEKASILLRLHGLRWAKRIERVTRPRWPFCTGRIGSAGVALLTITSGVILVLPLPFLNTIPALGIMLMALGLANRDGVFVVAGYIVCLGLLVAVAASPGLLMHALNRFG